LTDISPLSRGDWTTARAADWLETAPADWMDQAMPGWSDMTYGDVLRRTPSQWWAMVYGPAAGQPPWSAAQPVTPWRGRGDCGCGRGHHEHRHRHHRHHHHHHHHRHESHGCHHCGHERCECFCCLGDVDLAVYARVGEQRVVPIVIENERHREKDVRLELSSWATRGGREGAVRTVRLDPEEVTLPPCGRGDVTLVVAVGEAGENHAEGRTPDVDRCEVVTADLRLVGCDHRSLRLAVAILPRDCDPFTVHCGCECC